MYTYFRIGGVVSKILVVTTEWQKRHYIKKQAICLKCKHDINCQTYFDRNLFSVCKKGSSSTNLFICIFVFQYKLCKVKKVQTGPKGIPFLVTHDGRTIRYPDPIIKVNDTIQLEIATSKIMDSIRFEPGNLCMITGGRNLGRVGTVVNRERHPGSFDIVHVKDSQGHTFATR